jgi:hypothetical protein
MQLALHLRLPFIAVGHVEQLHDVSAVVAVALQRFTELAANRGVVGGERQQPHQPAGIHQPIAKHLGLRLLAALIETFEGDQ